MPAQLLHLLDPTTTPDAARMLAALFREKTDSLAVLGHRSTGTLFTNSLNGRLEKHESTNHGIHWIASRGWADPTGWRSLQRFLRQTNPEQIVTWGFPAALAAAVAAPQLPQVVMLNTFPTIWHTPTTWGRLALRWIETGGWQRNRKSRNVRWVGTSQRIVNHLRSLAIPEQRLSLIRPGIEKSGTEPQSADVRMALGILPEDGPVLLVGGEGGTHGIWGAGGRMENSRHDFGLWAAAILQQIFPRVRVVVREDPRGRENPGLERLMERLPDGEVVVVAPADMTWERLLPAADALLITADGDVEMNAALHAMAAGVPVVGTPIDAVREVINDGSNGLVSKELKPRSIAARVEDLLGDAPLREKIVTQAHLDVAERFGSNRMLQEFRQLIDTPTPQSHP